MGREREREKCGEKLVRSRSHSFYIFLAGFKGFSEVVIEYEKNVLSEDSAWKGERKVASISLVWGSLSPSSLRLRLPESWK